MREHMLAEIREDIKEMLQTQARIEERMAAHTDEMREHKAETKEELIYIHSKINPLAKAYNGIKWLAGALITAGTLITLYAKVL